VESSQSKKVAAKWDSLPVRAPRPKRQQQTAPEEERRGREGGREKEKKGRKKKSEPFLKRERKERGF